MAEMTVHARLIRSFPSSGMSVLLSTKAGQTEQQSKDGPVSVPFQAGNIVLARKNDTVVVGPISPAAAIDLAHRVLNGDQRAMTDPISILALAGSIVGFAYEPDPENAEPGAEVATNG